MLISVITICLNDLNNLIKSESSLKKQIYTNFEWIVIDGGSADGTREWLETNMTCNYWSSGPDSGIADAWNKGIALARGDYIIILNAGDIFYSNCLNELIKFASNSAIVCGNAYVSQSEKIVGLFRAQPNKLWRGMHIPHNWCLISKEIYKRVGEYANLGYSMDYEWFIRYKKIYGYSFRVVDQVLGEYALGGLSDRGYVKSFEMNYKIMVANGINRQLAFLIKLIYTAKHAIKRCLI